MKPSHSFLAMGLFLPLAGCIISPRIRSWPTGQQGQLTLSTESGFIVSAEINGQPVRLRVETGYSDVILNPDAAARVRLAKSMFDIKVAIGPVQMRGNSGVALLTVGGATDERRFVWFDKNITSDADGIISIANLPYETVTLQLGPASSDDVPATFLTTPVSMWNLTYLHDTGGKDIAVRFLLQAPRSFVTAAAGAALSDQRGGAWAGEPFNHVIAFDVARPVRPMTFARPVLLDTLAVNRILVRTSDFRGKYLLPTDAPQDPNEIVVTGNGGKGRAHLTMTLGRDYLSACSSISYVNRTRILTLQCRPRP